MALSGACYNYSMSNCCKENKDKCCGVGFHSIPAALGDDTGEFKPENGAYHNMLVKYEENGAIYLYTNDGAWVKIKEPVGGTPAYTITASNLQSTDTFATRNWSRSDADSIFYIAAYSSSSVTVTKDGSSVSTADLLDAGDSLLKATFSFDVIAVKSIGGGEPTGITMHVSATPTSVVKSNGGGLKISGTYCLDEAQWTEDPGSMAEPPLRFSLGVGSDNIWFQFETFEDMI